MPPTQPDLPEPIRRLHEEVDRRLAQAGVGSGDGVVVAVSGGVDSMVLLDALHHLAPRRRLRLHVAHLDHGLRPGSGADAAFVRQWAARLGWPATVDAADVGARARATGESTEQAGRACRRGFCERVRLDCDADWIVLGHHADDQAETVLLRLLRGAGPTGLAAIRPVAGRWLRPLLGVRRTDIAAYAEAARLPYREDETNRDLSIRRNRVRHELIPDLERRHNPRVVDGLNRTAALLQGEDDYLSAVSAEAARAVLKGRRPGGVTLDSGVLRGYHIAVQRRVLRQYIQEFAAHRPDDFRVLETAVGRLVAATTGMFQVCGGLFAEETGTEFILRREAPPPPATDLAIPGSTPVPASGARLTAVLAPSDDAALAAATGRPRPTCAVFDADVAEARLTLRSPRPGDRLAPFGMGGRHKKLSDCFIDAKWPRILRPEALVVSRCAPGAAEQILWVPGLARSDLFPVTASTRRILRLDHVADPPAPAPDTDR